MYRFIYKIILDITPKNYSSNSCLNDKIIVLIKHFHHTKDDKLKSIF